MSRYIDADALKYYGNHIGDEYEDRFHDAQWVYRNQIDDAPSIDIVRCKECKFWRAYETWSECERWTDDPYETAKTNADDFCSYGERREP